MEFSISSMTGFARAEGALENWRWIWELKSVNGRGLETRFRLPASWERIEPDLRKRLQRQFSRGSFNIVLAMQSGDGDARYQVNKVALDDAISAVEAVRLRTECAPPQPEGILNLRGVREQVEDRPETAALEKVTGALLNSFDQAADRLSEMRKAEGATMAKTLNEQLSEIERLTTSAADLAAAAPGMLRDRIARQLGDLVSGAGISEDRLAQEAAILAVKADIREELDRLNSHIEAGRALLGQSGAVGRQLDFLAQEFNRESNTLCSKAPDIALKQLGLDMKKVVDQLREQVQNIE